jgi:hypothetical protein
MTTMTVAGLCALVITVASGPSGPTCSSNVLSDTTCTHAAFKWTNETSFQACCATCTGMEKCNAWEFTTSGSSSIKKGNCHLKAEPGAREPQAGTTCGFPPPPAPQPTPPPPPAPAGAPNIVFFLCDDQDQMLGASFPTLNGATPMPKTEALLAHKGATATNFFIHTPICCPSRAELLSGRYFHNIKKSGGGCMHVDTDKVNRATFALNLQQGGYRVGMFGKYLNNVPAQVPPGFDAWLANGGGNYIAPEFSTKNLQFAGLPDGTWTGTVSNYSTSVIGNVSISWIRKVAAEEPRRPFFAYIAPKAAHEPFNPAPWSCTLPRPLY